MHRRRGPGADSRPTSASATPDAVPTTAPPVTEAIADGTGFGLLTAVRVAGQDGADRIVFEFAEAVPGYNISYVELPVYSDPAYELVPLAGAAALQVSLIGASAYVQATDVEPAYLAPDRIAGPGSPVTELVALGDWERVMVWAAGVSERTSFRVSTLDAHPGS